MLRLVMVGLIGALSLVLGGCGGECKHDIDVALTGSLVSNGVVTRPVEVDVVGIPKGEEGLWQAVTIDDYFALNNPFRTKNAGRAWAVKFSPDSRTTTAHLSKSDPMWERWSGCDSLMVLASVPAAQGGGVDARKELISRDNKRWPGNHIRIQVAPGMARSTADSK
jgi:hypothetical protein